MLNVNAAVVPVPSSSIDIGTGSTSFVIAHGPRVAFARNIEQGGHHIDKFVANQQKVSASAARAAAG